VTFFHIAPQLSLYLCNSVLPFLPPSTTSLRRLRAGLFARSMQSGCGCTCRLGKPSLTRSNTARTRRLTARFLSKAWLKRYNRNLAAGFLDGSCTGTCNFTALFQLCPHCGHNLFATPDDSIRTIIHEWNVSNSDNKLEDLFDSDLLKADIIKAYNKKFNSLDSTFTALLGKPISKKISKHFLQNTKRDGIKWTIQTNLNIYLLMFKRAINTYREIRAIIYLKYSRRMTENL